MEFYFKDSERSTYGNGAEVGDFFIKLMSEIRSRGFFEKYLDVS
jgi:hypothetical protein